MKLTYENTRCNVKTVNVEKCTRPNGTHYYKDSKNTIYTFGAIGKLEARGMYSRHSRHVGYVMDLA